MKSVGIGRIIKSHSTIRGLDPSSGHLGRQRILEIVVLNDISKHFIHLFAQHARGICASMRGNAASMPPQCAAVPRQRRLSARQCRLAVAALRLTAALTYLLSSAQAYIGRGFHWLRTRNLRDKLRTLGQGWLVGSRYFCNLTRIPGFRMYHTYV
jgi:hypothetical protein